LSKKSCNNAVVSSISMTELPETRITFAITMILKILTCLYFIVAIQKSKDIGGVRGILAHDGNN
jgi:hypothetical protein